MAIPLIMCRLKDDHGTVAEIGETALVYFSDWEPVPDGQLLEIEARNNMTELPQPVAKAAEQKPRTRTKTAEPVTENGE